MNLKISNLTKKYKSCLALDNVSLNLEPGIYGLIGPNGAGKSTLMNIIAGILKKYEGNLSCNSFEIFTNEYYANLGYVPQTPALYSELTCYEFLDYICTLKNINDKQVIDQILNKVNLLNKKDIKIKNLSGGMKQRLSIAQALVNNPKILLLDEPTNGLDPLERLRLKNLLKEISLNKIIIVSTHIIGDMENLADYLVFLKEGKMLSLIKPENIISKLQQNYYETTISKDELENFSKKYIITWTLTKDNEVTIRFFCKNKLDYPNLNKPSLEEVYLYYYGDFYDQE